MLEKYAQEIADTTAKIIGYGVLVTDRNGIVIGSSDRSRIGQEIAEAPSVMTARAGYRMTAEEAAEIANTKAGVTYPIEDTDGSLLGTIAITGDPDKVDPFAMIVKKQAEMYLREQVFLETAFYRERATRTFVEDVLVFDPRISKKEILERRGKEFGYDRGQRYLALCGRYRFPTIAGERAYRVSSCGRILSFVKDIFPGGGNIAAFMDGNTMALFLALEERNKGENAALDSVIGKCRSLIARCSGIGIEAYFGAGSPVSDIAEWSRSYREAKEALGLGKAIFPSRNIFPIKDYRFQELVYSAEKEARTRFVQDKLKPINGLKDAEEIKETILKWCENDFITGKTAEVLHVHRNTLHYRMDKIERLTGTKMKSFLSMAEIYLALQLERMDAACMPF